MMAQRRAREAGEGAMGLHTKATKMVALLANEHDGGGEGGAPAPASVPAPGTNGTVRGAELDRDREEGEREQKASAFEDFVQSVGPHMRSLVVRPRAPFRIARCARTLDKS